MTTLIVLTLVLDTTINEDELPVENTTTVAVNADHIRSFNPRRNNAVGTRMTFKDGGGFAVTETFEEVLAALVAAGATRIGNADIPAVVEAEPVAEAATVVEATATADVVEMRPQARRPRRRNLTAAVVAAANAAEAAPA